ncbi:hypothetical protein [Myceligenerans cantabricum]
MAHLHEPEDARTSATTSRSNICRSRPSRMTTVERPHGRLTITWP